MTLELAALPLALFAGLVGVLSPCVWPLVPVVTSSATVQGRSGLWWLAAGLSLSFAVSGTLLTWMIVSMGLDPEIFRYVAGALLLVLAAILLVPIVGRITTNALSRLTGLLDVGGGAMSAATSPSGQFGVGALLGFVWLPCVGPTLGAAIALASMGQTIGMAFAVMLAYGLGTTVALVGAGIASGHLLRKWRPGLVSGGQFGRRLLGASLLVLGLLVVSGFDKTLEALAVDLLPAWIFTL